MPDAVAVAGGPPVLPRAVAHLLSRDDRDRMATLHRPLDRARFATGRALLRSLAAREVGGPASAVTLDVRCPECGEPHGRPRLVSPQGSPPVHAGISHAGNWVLVAVAGAPVGIDVEPCTATAFAGFDPTALTAGERDELDAMPPELRADARARAWVSKEAVLKLHGVGLRREPSQLHIGLSPEDRVLPDPLGAGGHVALRFLALDGEHRAALAVFGTSQPSVSFVAADVLLAAPEGTGRTTTR